MTIRDRVLARTELDGMRAARDITGLAAALNDECVEAIVPVRVTADTILYGGVHQEVIFALLQKAAIGDSVQVAAQELLSEPGAEAFEPGFEPPMVTQLEVAEALYNPDGTEK